METSRHPFSRGKLNGCRFMWTSLSGKEVRKLKLKIKVGKNFEFSFNIDKAVVFAILMLVC